MFGIGFSDNVVFRKQYYLRAIPGPELRLEIHTGEAFQDPRQEGSSLWEMMRAAGTGWEFDIGGTGFRATCRIDLDFIPENGEPRPLGVGNLSP